MADAVLKFVDWYSDAEYRTWHVYRDNIFLGDVYLSQFKTSFDGNESWRNLNLDEMKAIALFMEGLEQYEPQ